MTSLETVYSLIPFALNSLLISNFIVPQAQKLKEIKDQLIKFGIANIPSSVSMIQHQELKVHQRQDIEKLQYLLDIYRIRSKELDSLVKVFRYSVYAVIISIELVVLFVRLGYNPSFVPILNFFAQLMLLFWAVKVYAVDPNRLQDVGYLVNELDINPHSLINALDMSLSYSNEKSWSGSASNLDPLKIILSLNARVFGFRFLYLIHDEKSNVYYVSFGPITTRSQLTRCLLPPDKGRKEEYNLTSLGEFQFNIINRAKTLKIAFFVFLPLVSSEPLHPLVMRQSFEKREGEMITAWAGGGRSVRLDTTENEIRYFVKKAQVTCVEYVGSGNGGLLKKIIDKYASEFIKTNKIRSFSSTQGNLI